MVGFFNITHSESGTRDQMQSCIAQVQSTAEEKSPAKPPAGQRWIHSFVCQFIVLVLQVMGHSLAHLVESNMCPHLLTIGRIALHTCQHRPEFAAVSSRPMITNEPTSALKT